MRDAKPATNRLTGYMADLRERNKNRGRQACCTKEGDREGQADTETEKGPTNAMAMQAMRSFIVVVTRVREEY